MTPVEGPGGNIPARITRRFTTTRRWPSTTELLQPSLACPMAMWSHTGILNGLIDIIPWTMFRVFINYTHRGLGQFITVKRDNRRLPDLTVLTS